ncbi:2-hydroxychromene-2-carboxylate isomerase [Streptomyces cupreus]|uniref:2-hydroxychromene-2-carboxylate isomerase n=1 Tax=Streptomyces cupreus TaxID=2759956 RepID=A0A7X1J3T1_9ACTN|nr:DsbA family protein [Streptomyces cupreus]MBC2903688.1 DsbA family protein [Streptomyces cupreus]
MTAHTLAAPRFYFSFRSPYSWLAHHDLLEWYPGLADELAWIPFWEPDRRSERMLTDAGGSFPYVPMSRAKHLYVLQDVRRLVTVRGLTVVWPVDRDPCWEVPHLAYLVAAEQGAGQAFADQVYRARWQQGHDICDRAVVAGIAKELGLDAEALGGAADDEQARAAGLDALLAADRDGVFGVPFFVHRHDRYWGVDRLASFAWTVRALHGGRPRPLAGGGSRVLSLGPDASRIADGGHAGGCG